jgi:DNA-binding IclR family transcriptional regulator
MWPAQPNRSLIDGIACLQALATSGAPAGVCDLARRLGLETTRAHRLLKTLAHLGFARQTPQRKYGPGPAMHVLSAQSLFASGLIRRALDPLKALRRHGLIVALGMLWREHVCYLYHAMPGMTPGEALGRLGLYPAPRSSIGMVLTSRLSGEEIREIYRDRKIPGYPGGLRDLRADLRRIMRQGYAHLVHARHPRHVTMAVPVGDPPDSALAFSGNIPAAERDHYLAILRDTARRILMQEDPADAGTRLEPPDFQGDPR